jgi:hypothetical protein
MNGIIKKIRERVGTVNPVYLSIDIDTLDPACKLILSFRHCPISCGQRQQGRDNNTHFGEPN